MSTRHEQTTSLVANIWKCNSSDVEDLFYKSLVYIFSNDESGSIGFIINRHSTYLLSDAMPDMIGYDRPIFYGGPVDDDKLFIVHDRPDLLSFDRKEGNLCLSSNLDELCLAIKMKQIGNTEVKLFMGYCGWDAGEFNHEQLDQSWTAVQANNRLFFEHDLARLRTDVK